MKASHGGQVHPRLKPPSARSARQPITGLPLPALLSAIRFRVPLLLPFRSVYRLLESKHREGDDGIDHELSEVEIDHG